ncbi:type IV pilus modification protein PilV [Neisseria musculi]|uniref:Type IV pilus modification protein PilV n=3 Tax=Neisseriaceae TaxID=481 RepID=A0A7H1M7T1_9NEIS|nr:type IV pilus modification protein PilV [Neisseria musculi]QNT57696.1 type IV pilus modification protein PilV [Neisseria musculi]
MKKQCGENMHRILYPNHLKTDVAASAQQESGRLKQRQGGMTLVEVLVAMFVLAVGVLALLATQLRTVSGVREAESQTIVAQAVQNLMEGMQINPTLSAASGDTGWVNKSYDAYMKNGIQTIKGNVAGGNNPGGANAGNPPQLTKSELVDEQIRSFESALGSALPNAEVRYAICRGVDEMEIDSNGNVDANCKNSGPLMVKVLWQIDSEQADVAPAVKSYNSNIVYTYQARVPD